MLGEFNKGSIIDLSVIFISRVSGELFDPINPTVEISHYNGTTEIIDLSETPVIKVTSRSLGYFTYQFVVPNSFTLGILYFVRWRGEDPLSCAPQRDVVEDQFLLADPSSSGICSPCGLVPRFCGC